MKKMNFSKQLFAAFLMLFCFGVTTMSAQTFMDAASGTQTTNEVINFDKVDKETAKQSLSQEITTLKSSASSATSGSEEYVDAMRRIEVFAVVSRSLTSGESVKHAYDAGVNHLYRKLHFKQADNSKINQIHQTLRGLLAN